MHVYTCCDMFYSATVQLQANSQQAMHMRVETGSAYPGQSAHPGHILSVSSGSKLVYKISKSDLHSEFDHTH